LTGKESEKDSSEVDRSRGRRRSGLKTFLRNPTERKPLAPTGGLAGARFGARSLNLAMFFRSARESPTPILNIIPFTSFPGRETQAAFSPDGNQIAFIWDGGKGNNSDSTSADRRRTAAAIDDASGEGHASCLVTRWPLHRFLTPGR